MTQQSRRFLAAAVAVAAASVILVIPSSVLFVETGPRDGAETDGGKRYACPMLCTIRTSPGDCPVCGMDMTEIKETEGGLELSRYERKMIGLKTAEAGFRTLWRTFRSIGRFEADETRVRQVAAWIDGRIDRLYADYTGMVVNKGDPLFEVYSPVLYESQQSLLTAVASAREARDPRAKEIHERNAASMRRRLQLFGLTAAQIDAIVESGELRTHVDVVAPISGTIIEKHVVEGQYVKEGQMLAVVADLSRLWVKVDVFEEDAPWISLHQQVKVSPRSLPTEPFEGVIAFIDPLLDESTRSVEARVEVRNEGGKLRPGMFADVEVRVPLDYHGRPYLLEPAAEGLPQVLAVPKPAVLATGARHLVYVMESPPRYVERDDGTRVETAPARFVGREVGVGPLADGWWPILSGLKPGDRVATRGNFLIDSQMQLSGQPSLMHVPPASDAANGR